MSNIEQDQPFFEFIEDEVNGATLAGRPPVFIDGDEYVDAPRPGSDDEES